MTLEFNLQTAFTRIGTEVKALIPPPLDTFTAGWVQSGYPAIQLGDVVETVGTVHAAVNIGPETPTISSTVFDQSSTDTADTNIPNNATGWTGTNWQIVRGGFAATPPTIGNNTGRTEVTPYADLPDASFGTVTDMDVLCETSMRRNCAIRFSNLTIGNRYYGIFCFFAYPNSLTRATIITPDDGDLTSDTFGVDGTGFILSNGVRRYGWTATATSIEFIKASYDNSGSYLSAFVCVDVGV